MKPTTAMKSRVVFALAFTASLFAGNIFAQSAPAGDIPLYLSPDTTTTVLLSVKADDARLAAAKPAADAAKAATGWQTIELKDAVTGYAPMNTARKDLSILPGTPVRVAPEASATAIGEAAASPATMITIAQGDWAEVSFPGPVTAYFMKAAPVAAPAPTPAPAPVTPAPVPQPMAVAATSVPMANPTATPTPRYYYGVFKQRTDVKIPGPESAQYILTSANGQLLALLDLRNVSLAKPVTAYLNKPIKIYGIPQATTTFPYVLVTVQLLQLN